jgi:hypothetical protein
MFCWSRPCMRQFVRLLLRTYWCWHCMSHASVCKPISSYTWMSTFMHMHVLLMSTLHASVCTTVTAYILMSTLHVACISMYTNFIIHTDVDVSCISVYVCILCRCWRFICQHANLLMCTNLLAYLCNFYWHKHCLHLCKQCVHLYLQVMSMLACVRICVNRLTK